MSNKQAQARKNTFRGAWRDNVDTTPGCTDFYFRVSYRLAAYLSADGTSTVFPSPSTIAKELGRDARSVRRAFEWLEENGHSRNKRGAGTKPPTITLLLDGKALEEMDSGVRLSEGERTPSGLEADLKRTRSGLATRDSVVASNSSRSNPKNPENLGNPGNPVCFPRAGARAKTNTLLFDAIAEACNINVGEPLTRSTSKALEKAASELDEIGATPADVHKRAKVYRDRFPDRDSYKSATLTPAALVRHWGECRPYHIDQYGDEVYDDETA